MRSCLRAINPLNANFTKWPNKFDLPTTCLSVFGHFVKLALNGLKQISQDRRECTKLYKPSSCKNVCKCVKTPDMF